MNNLLNIYLRYSAKCALKYLHFKKSGATEQILPIHSLLYNEQNVPFGTITTGILKFASLVSNQQTLFQLALICIENELHFFH